MNQTGNSEADIQKQQPNCGRSQPKHKGASNDSAINCSSDVIMLGFMKPCAQDGSTCMLHDHTPATDQAAAVSAHNPQLSALYHSGNAARWRRKQEDYFNHQRPVLSGVRQERSMEEVHGVDVSWLHKPGKQQQGM